MAYNCSRGGVAITRPRLETRWMVSVAGSPAAAPPAGAAASMTRLMVSRSQRGRTPSCTMIRSGSGDTCATRRRTDSCRVGPPHVYLTRKLQEQPSISFARLMWEAGRAMTTWTTSSREAMRSRVRRSMGLPARLRNCFGSQPPIRAPAPPAARTTATLGLTMDDGRWTNGRLGFIGRRDENLHRLPRKDHGLECVGQLIDIEHVDSTEL